MEFRMKKSFEAFGLRWSRTKERGATAVVIALCLTLVMAAAAMSFDTANRALKRQALQNLTDAAAQAGAVYLRDNPKNLAGAQLAAYNFAHDADSTFKMEDVTLWCIVASDGDPAHPNIAPGNIPAVCDPITYVGKKCDASLCSIQITLPSNASANAIQVKHTSDVKYYFAPAIGIPKGSTGAVASVSCAKSCGSGGIPNPADVAIVADRTPSMSNSDFDKMKSGIMAGLATMTPEYQSVTLGTIDRSRTSTTDPYCLTSLGAPTALVNKSAPSYYESGGARKGAWMPMGFSNSYLNGVLTDPAGTRTLKVTKNTTSLGYQVQCMDHVANDTTANPNPYYVAGTQVAKYPWGTHLAAPLKAAAQALYYPNNSNLQALSDYRTAHYTTVPAKKWIIFETDGQPDETMGYKASPTTDRQGKVTIPGYTDANTDPGTTNIKTAGEPTALNPFTTSADTQACNNFLNVAQSAKDNGINIIMIAFGDATTVQCGNMSGTVADVMAKAASSTASGPSTNPGNCTTANADKDYFFCATTGTELASVFATVIGMTSSPNTKFVKMPK